MTELAPFEGVRKLADGSAERAFFFAESSLLAWLYECDAEEVQAFYQDRRIDQAALVEAFRAFDPQTATYDERDLNTLAAR